MDWKALVGSQVLLLILLSSGATTDDGEKKVVCYYTNWSVYRPGTAKFSPQNINPYLCTHLIYAFGGFTKDNTLKPFDKYQDVDKGGYAKFTGLKTYNKNLKTLLAVGGWNEGSNRFSPMVADPQRRRQFVKSAVKFLRQNHFDGLDLDWEYPAFREGGKPRDRDNYANLVQELREEFEKESSKTGRPRLLLTMAVPAGIEYIDKGYDIPKLDEYLDFMNLLSYDYHSAYEPAVNHHSPLYPLEEDNEYNYDNELTIDYTIKHLIKSGASSEKIVVGIPTYGRSYTLFNDDANTLGSPADGPGIEGDATREKGYLAYYEICESVTKDDWIVEKPNPKAMGPYAYKSNQWVGYDDEDIVRAKAKYVNEKKLGGIMFWSIDNDDFRGKCHGRPYPLIEAAKEALFEENGKQKADERPNSISTKKRNRVSESSKSSLQSSNRKSSGSSNRRNTLSRSTTGKRSSIPTKSRNRSNFKTANEYKPEDESNDENDESNENVESAKSVQKSTRPRLLTNKNRFRTRLNINERDSIKKQTSDSTSTTKTVSNNKKVTTPEPPTTPDPGSDFKCEDEGFFPHPRDCKKYFWCLDSGPSGLGIVANQFTCPSGLVFNKLADSCDYPRNVICPKSKPKSITTTTTTQRTTTEKEKELIEEEQEEEEEEEYEDEQDEVKSSEDKNVEEEKPKKIRTTTAKSLLYKTINRSRPTTTTRTTTTSSTPPSTPITASLGDDISDEEQDPRVIKELIDLIKKAGGIEHLEKQLAFQEKSLIGGSNQGNGQVTPATISKSLYERVLNQKSAKNNLFGLPTSRLVSSRKTDDLEEEEDEEDEEQVEEKKNSKVKFVNGPGRSQFEGLDEVPEVKNLRKTNKPKYVTIKRQSSSTASSNIDDELDENNDDVEEEVEPEEDNENVASSEEKLISNISEEKNLSVQRSTPGYVNIRRGKPTSTTEPSRADNDIKDEEPSIRHTSFRPTELIQKEVTEENIAPKTRYISINRFRSTTATSPTETEQTTIESTSKKPTITTENFNDRPLDKEKTITVSGESGRISIIPFTSVTPSTARILSDHTSSTVKSTSPYTEEQFISTHYTTKKVTETTTPLNPNTIEDSATESLFNIASTESSTRETIAAVSQPRPFGFPRRTRPTVALSTFSDTTRSSLTGIESTSRSKVSTYSRNIARSTTKAPRTHTRSRTRNREKSISTVDEHLNVKDEALQNNSELQENPKDTEVVSKSRSSISNRGSSRYKSQNTTHSHDSNFKETTNSKEQSKSTETSNRRHRRPLVTTISSDLQDPQVFKISTEKSVRSRNVNRLSRVRLDQQAADSFANKAQTIRNINLLMEPINPTTTSFFYTTSKIKPEITDISIKDVDDITQTENSRFLIEVTETIPSETTTEKIDKEAFNLLESSSKTTVPSYLWNTFLTTLQNSEDESKTTFFDSTTAQSLIKSSTALKDIDTTLLLPNQRTRKILLRKRPSTTPISIEQPSQNIINSRRRMIVRRLRPFQEDIFNLNSTELSKDSIQNINELANRTHFRNLNDNNQTTKNSTHSSLSYSGISRSPSQRHFIRNKVVARPDSDISTAKIDGFDDVTSKRKSLFDRYRTSALASTHQLDVLDEPILQHSVFENITAHKTTSNFMTEIPKKTSILNNSLHSKPENDARNVSLIQKSLLMNPSNQHNIKRIIKVPVKFVDDPADEFFLLQIPKNKLNISRFSSVLKIEVLKPDEPKDVNKLKIFDDNNILNRSLMTEKLNLLSHYDTEITEQSTSNFDTSKLNLNYDNSTSKNDIFLDDNEKKLFSKNSETTTSDFALKDENLNSLIILKNAPSLILNKNLTINKFEPLAKNSETKKNESAIYNSKNLLINYKHPFLNTNSTIENTELLPNLRNSTVKKKIHRQRVLIYRSSANQQPTNNSSQRRWTMKKVVRRRLRPASLKSTDDLETSASASLAVSLMNDSFAEVNSSRHPGLSFFQRPEDISLPQGAYATLSSATLSPTRKIYPVQNGIGDTRVLAITADQNGIPQNLELILPERPTTISSSTNSGRAAITGPSFRRKISTTISPRTTQETSSSTSSNTVISSERRRQGQKYGSDRIIIPNSYQTYSRPYKPAVTDYDYYEDEEERFVGKPNGKILITSRGIIKCLDQGNFPHPSSCKKFISCAKMVNGNVMGTEYTCPKKLSFDPIGGICNWSAGLGCND